MSCAPRKALPPRLWPALLLLLAALAGPAWAGQPERYRFDCQGCTLEAAERAALVQAGDFLLAFYRPYLAIRPDFCFRFRLFGAFTDYQHFRALYAPTLEVAEGFYSGRLRTIALYLGRQFPAVAFHEMNHAVLGGHLGDVPPWLGEGLSEFFEGLTLGERVRVRPQLQKRRRLVAWLGEGRDLDLPGLLAISRAEWPARNVAAGRAHSTLAWGIAWHLMREASGRRLLGGLLRELAAGGDPGARLAQEYPGGLEGLARDLGRTFAPSPAAPGTEEEGPR